MEGWIIFGVIAVILIALAISLSREPRLRTTWARTFTTEVIPYIKGCLPLWDKIWEQVNTTT